MVNAAVGPGAPAGPDGLTGRVRELAQLRRLARRTRLLTLCGPPGAGKTRLLRELLPTLARDYPDGTHVVSLADLLQPGLLVARVAAALGVAAEPGMPLADTLAHALRGRRLALGLDGGDHLRGACASLGARLLAGSPGLLLVTASRKPLGVAAETVWPVPPLSLPAPGDDSLAGAARSGAVRLFADRAAAAAPGFALDAGNCAAVTAACRALAGLPLAIELAAARAGELAPAALAAALAASPRSAGPRGASPPGAYETGLEGAIGWSHDRLDPAAQVLLRRLSVFAGWSLEMAERVCVDDAVPAAAVHGLLAGLARAGLVQPEPPRRGPGRYRMPGAIRDFAAARLAEAGEDELLRRRLRDFVAQHVEYLTTIGKARVPLTWPSFQELFRSYQADSRNVRAVLAWCLEHGDTYLGLRICTELGICWMALGQYDEGGRWLGAFLDAGRGPSVPAAVRGPALAVRAQVAIFSSRMAGARTWATAGLDLCRAAGDVHYTVISLNALSQIELGAANTEQALRLAREALAQARQSGDTWNEAYALNNQAAALRAAGDLAGARASGEASLALALDTEQHFGAALARLELADITRALGDADAARGHLEALLPFARQAMPRPDTVRCLAGLTAIALGRGDLAAARDYLADSLALCLRAGQRAGMAGGLLGFAELAARQGRPGRAVELAAAAAALCESAQLPAPDKDVIQRYRDAAADAAQADRRWAAGLRLTSAAAVRLALGQANHGGGGGTY